MAEWAQEEPWEEEESLSTLFLTFYLGEECFGIEIRYVTEIVCIPPITEVPDLPSFIKGVVNLRGQVIPVLDLRLKFRMPPCAYDDKTCVIITRVEERLMGLIVDTVQDVREIQPPNISPPPQATTDSRASWLLGFGKVGDIVIILLDVQKIVVMEDLEAIPVSSPKCDLA